MARDLVALAASWRSPAPRRLACTMPRSPWLASAGMDEERRRAGRGQRRGDLAADVAALAHAHHDDAAAAGEHRAAPRATKPSPWRAFSAEQRARLDVEASARASASARCASKAVRLARWWSRRRPVGSADSRPRHSHRLAHAWPSTLELTCCTSWPRCSAWWSAARCKLPPMLGYLAVGVLIGPNALALARRLGRRRAPGRVRRRVPDVRDRARVQPAQAAQHAQAGVRPRPEPGGAHDRSPRVAGNALLAWAFALRRHAVGPRLAERDRARRRAGDELDRDRRQADGRAARARERARPARDGRAAVPGLGRGAAAGADPGARHRRPRRCCGALGARAAQGRRRCWRCCWSAASA